MSTELTIKPGQTGFDQKQVAALHQLGFGGNNTPPTPADLTVFFHQCQRTGLDPFLKQIYMVTRFTKDGPKATIQTGIDGFRLIARRACDKTGETLGYGDTEWCGSDGVWRDVWLSKEPPAASRVTVLRNGQKFTATVLFDEYAQKTKSGDLTRFWLDMPATMISKVAEVAALRKAFPQDLSGVYSDDEMAQADNQPSQPFRQQPQQRSNFRAKLAAVPEPDEIDVEIVDAEPLETPQQAKRGRPRKTNQDPELVKTMWQLMSQIGVANPDMAPIFIKNTINREIGSSQELTNDEIRLLIEACNAEIALETAA